LLSMPPTITIAKAIQLIKGGSSKWIHETFPALGKLAWQEGYGGFSVSISHMKDAIDYINRQAEHHRKKTFEEEYRSFLKKHGIKFDEKYLWG
jgi:putative transposase